MVNLPQLELIMDTAVCIDVCIDGFYQFNLFAYFQI